MLERTFDPEIITDFETGVDAIEFMIEGFGYEDIAVLREPDTVSEPRPAGGLRLVHTGTGDMADETFHFDAQG